MNNTSISSDLRYFSFSGAISYQQFIKENPQYLDNEYFVMTNLHYNTLKIKDFAPHIKNNPLFLMQYFAKCEADPKEYSLISPELLSNTMFINSVIHKNPDIYLLASPSAINSTTDSLIAHYHPQSQLKYATAELLTDFDYCYKTVNRFNDNFQYLCDQFKENNGIVQIVFKSNNFNKEQPLAKYLTEKQKNDPTFIKHLLDFNKGIFPFLPKKYYQDKKLLASIIKVKTEYFKFVPKDFLQDQDFIHNILNAWTGKPSFSDSFCSFNRMDILKHLPLSYFTEEFCTTYSQSLGKNFTSLPQSHTGNPNILRAAFNYDNLKNNASNITMAYLSHINDYKVKINLKEIFKRHKPHSNSFRVENLNADIEPFLKSFWLFEKLNNEIPKNTTIEKKKKI